MGKMDQPMLTPLVFPFFFTIGYTHRTRRAPFRPLADTLLRRLCQPERVGFDFPELGAASPDRNGNILGRVFAGKRFLGAQLVDNVFQV